jgi:hypothetical protein
MRYENKKYIGKSKGEVVPMLSIKTYAGVKLQLYPFVNSALDGGK